VNNEFGSAMAVRPPPTPKEKGRMQTYVAEIDGRAIFAFRSIDVICAQAWLDVHGLMRQTLARLQSGGRAIWDGRSEIVAREATSSEEVTWIRSSDQGASKEQLEEPNNLTVWLIPDPAEPQFETQAVSQRRNRR
jgi:hypothetical protein